MEYDDAWHLAHEPDALRLVRLGSGAQREATLFRGLPSREAVTQ